MMSRETKSCPFYGMPCEYVPMAEKADEAADRIEQLEAALRLLHDNVVHAWPSLADLGPVAIARAALEEKR